jgi:hypothetical protein
VHWRKQLYVEDRKQRDGTPLLGDKRPEGRTQMGEHTVLELHRVQTVSWGTRGRYKGALTKWSREHFGRLWWEFGPQFPVNWIKDPPLSGAPPPVAQPVPNPVPSAPRSSVATAPTPAPSSLQANTPANTPENAFGPGPQPPAPPTPVVSAEPAGRRFEFNAAAAEFIHGGLPPTPPHP